MYVDKLTTWLESHPRVLTIALSSATFAFTVTTNAAGGGSTIGGL
ncbi:hypothetical protein [Haloferax sp. DFSO60]